MKKYFRAFKLKASLHTERMLQGVYISYSKYRIDAFSNKLGSRMCLKKIAIIHLGFGCITPRNIKMNFR